MRRIAAAALLFLSIPAAAQTLFTYGGTPVSKQEFLRVYTKNTAAGKPDFSEKALREYLDLYSLFKMKVAEANGQRLDTVATLGRELDNYRRQLARTYLTDDRVAQRLVEEAYNRSKEEVRVAHILLLASPSALPDDTLIRTRVIDSLYRVATSGKADFAALARKFSEDRGSNTAGGDIGYMTALQTVYQFENAAYITPVGGVSKPFRTQFGYHIVKVLDRRPARGEVVVEQILAAAPASRGAEGEAAALRKLDSVRTALRKGASFAELAKKFSDDKFTAAQGGAMEPFGVGRTTPAFEAAAFGLKKPGDMTTEPVKTEYGYHLIRLVRRIPPAPYDSVKTSLKRRVEADARAQTAKEAYDRRVKAEAGFQDYPAALDALVSSFAGRIPDTGSTAGTFRAADFADMRQPLFTLGGRSYTQSDFMAFAEATTRGRIPSPAPALTRDLYRYYQTNVLNDFQEQQLATTNADFKALMDEYRDGILLFELMDRSVWSKAGRDTIGLQKFFDARKSGYTWEPGFRGYVFKLKDEAALQRAQGLLGSTNNPDTLTKVMNSESDPNAVTAQRGRYEWSRFTEVPRENVAVRGQGVPLRAADGSYTLTFTQEVFQTAAPKTLEDARGYVVAEYQDVLEKEWNAALRAKYPVRVEEAVFRSMVKR